MARTKTSRVHRHLVTDKPHELLTGAEARAEAAYMVLEAVLSELPPSMYRRVMARSFVAADALRISAVTEEVECLFTGITFEPPTR